MQELYTRTQLARIEQKAQTVLHNKARVSSSASIRCVVVLQSVSSGSADLRSQLSPKVSRKSLPPREGSMAAAAATVKMLIEQNSIADQLAAGHFKHGARNIATNYVADAGAPGTRARLPAVVRCDGLESDAS